MEFTLKTAFDSSDPKVAELGPASFSVEQDIDKVVDKVKKFVEDYNKLVQSPVSYTHLDVYKRQ